MVDVEDLAAISRAIQLSVAPVFLITGIGGVLNVISGRMGRVLDRSRWLEHMRETAATEALLRYAYEQRTLDRRVVMLSRAIMLSVASAVAISAVVALLFVAILTGWHLATAVALVFVLAMVLLVAALAIFLIEVRYAARVIRIRKELLQHEGEAETHDRNVAAAHNEKGC